MAHTPALGEATSVKSISYIVRKAITGYTVIESMDTSEGNNHQQLIQHALSLQQANDMADDAQARWDAWNIRASFAKAGGAA